MYAPPDQLTELVRHLEAKQHVFSADPLLITDKLRDEPSNTLTKLQHRASRIDVDGKLATTLQTIQSRIQAIIMAVTVLWFVLGFAGIVAVMQTQQLNFFYVLVSLLGFHTLMLLIWLVWLLFASRNKSNAIGHLFRPSNLVRSKDPVMQSAVQLYDEQLQHTGTKWYISRISHQFWLASLSGMLLALVFMLLVRDYTFVWQSTLLQNNAVVKIVEVLSYLPNLVGFPTPTSADILQAQHPTQANLPEIWYRWAMLLISSLLMYGIVPRFVVWALSFAMLKTQRIKLNIKEPYYQKILDYWQRGVIDPDDSPTEAKPVAPTAKISADKKLVVLLEYAYPDEYWYQFVAGHQIEDFGVLDERDDMDRLTAYLQNHPVQVLVGIPPQALPDRGSMRKLDKIASLATGGLAVQLLNPSQNYLLPAHEQALADERKAQWETALAERKIGLVRL